MGYYITTTEADFRIKKENLRKGYELLCELNAHDELKTGGRYGSTTPKPADSRSVSNSPDKWFSFMDWNYDELCDTLDEILEDQLGFEVWWSGEPGDSDIDGIWLSAPRKSGAEEDFFHALAPVVEDGSYLIFHGEEDDYWRYEFHNGEMKTLQGYIEFY